MTDRPNPFEEIEELFEQLNASFSEINESVGTELGGKGIKVDVADNGEEIVVVADVPGFESADIDVSVQNRRLTISAETSDETETDEAGDYYRRERTSRSASRTVTLPADVDEAEARASYENGVLTVELPKIDAGEGGIDIDID